jgi:hypothetical protein
MQQIRQECFTKEYVLAKQRELQVPDKMLLEKAIRALALLGALAARDLPFIFKGGSALLLRLNPLRRLSIDIDIIWRDKPAKLLNALKEIAAEPPFHRFEEYVGKKRRLPARRHFKFYYKAMEAKYQTPFVLLDVVLEENIYPRLERIPLNTPFIDTRRNVEVEMPTVAGLLGDKLTAFAPNTVGVPCDTHHSQQVIKQVFDIGELFNVVGDLTEVRETYATVFEAERGYRKLRIKPPRALQDTMQTAFLLSQIDLPGAVSNETTRLLSRGIEQIGNHVLGARYDLTAAQISAAKAACLAAQLLSRNPVATLDAIRFSPERVTELRDVQLAGSFEILNQLTANAEALWYWHQAQQVMK